MPEEPKLTRKQKRAQAAYDAISSEIAIKDKDYPKLAKRFPALVHNCGLAQAVAFVQAKEGVKPGERGGRYLSQLSRVMETGGKDIASISREEDVIRYQRFSREAIESATWLKRYAEALLDTKNKPVAKNSNEGEGDRD